MAVATRRIEPLARKMVTRSRKPREGELVLGNATQPVMIVRGGQLMEWKR